VAGERRAALTTAANASAIDPDAVISRAGDADRHSGISAGTSIIPTPCAPAIANDHNASPAGPPDARQRQGRRPDTWTAATNTARPPATQGKHPRCAMKPSAASSAISATDAAWPMAVGASAHHARMRSPTRTRETATRAQPVAGFRPWAVQRADAGDREPGPGADHDGLAGQARAAQQDDVGAEAGADSWRSWWRTHSTASAIWLSSRPLGAMSSRS
jgi:hypothetical protein